MKYRQLTMLWQLQVDSKGTQPYIYVSILPHAPLSSRLPHNIEQTFMFFSVGSCWLSILNIAVRPTVKLSDVQTHIAETKNQVLWILYQWI